jgi:bifunctional non-homologous end joining protein LigD
VATQRLNASYRGHSIIVEADEELPGRWGWFYLIDSRISTLGTPRQLPDAATALQEGLKAARARVSALERNREVGPSFPELMPMLAEEVKRPFSGGEWAFEVKFDGYRALAEWDGGTARMKSRRSVDMTAWFPEVMISLSSFGRGRCVVDGEVCVLNEEGIAGDAEFQRLFVRSARRGYKRGDDPVTFLVFDALVVNGRSVMQEPLPQRRALIEPLLRDAPHVRLVDQVLGQGEAMYQAALLMGLEGIVAKRLAAPYQPGARSRDWLKIKRPGAVPAERFRSE